MSASGRSLLEQMMVEQRVRDAAPIMLTTLKSVLLRLEEIDPHSVSEDILIVVAMARNEIRIAISKAMGEEP